MQLLLVWGQHDYIATQEVQKPQSRRGGEYCTSWVAKSSYWSQKTYSDNCFVHMIKLLYRNISNNVIKQKKCFCYEVYVEVNVDKIKRYIHLVVASTVNFSRMLDFSQLEGNKEWIKQNKHKNHIQCVNNLNSFRRTFKTKHLRHAFPFSMQTNVYQGHFCLFCSELFPNFFFISDQICFV